MTLTSLFTYIQFNLSLIHHTCLILFNNELAGSALRGIREKNSSVDSNSTLPDQIAPNSRNNEYEDVSDEAMLKESLFAKSFSAGAYVEKWIQPTVSLVSEAIHSVFE